MTEGTITAEQQETTGTAPATAGTTPAETAGTAKPVEPSTKGEKTAGTATTPMTETEIVALQDEVKQAKKLQGQADRKARQERVARKRLQQKIQSGTGEPPSEPEGEDPPDTFQEVEQAKFEGSAIRLAYSSEEYRKVLEADPTLRKIIESNPLALIKNPIDAEDAVMQLQEVLDTRVDELSEPSPKPKEEKPEDKEKPTTEETPAGFGSEVVNPQGIPEGEYKEDLKKGNVNEAVWKKMQDPKQWNQPSA